ncbi:hypothetical protein ACFWF9_24990, partial [Streptomyces roseolus]|uniref:hypothetical protein n=1 Tax=Streptomyces roseolus TaxID=67358 RepID=UPI00364BC05C
LLVAPGQLGQQLEGHQQPAAAAAQQTPGLFGQDRAAARRPPPAAPPRTRLPDGVSEGGGGAGLTGVRVGCWMGRIGYWSYGQ